MSPHVSIKSLTADWQCHPQRSIEALAHSTPDVTHIAPHVFEAHEDAKKRIVRGEFTFEVTFNPDLRAFDLVPQNDEALHALRTLGPGIKLTLTL